MSSYGEEAADAACGKEKTCALSDVGRDHPALDKTRVDSNEKSGSSIKCKECGIMCAGKSNYDTHLRSHTGKRPFICKICGFGFTQKGNLRRHIKIHSDEKPFQCSICFYKCRRRDALNGHMKVHSDLRPFCCKYCDRSYKSHQSAKDHELVCIHKVRKSLHNSLREKASSLDSSDQSSLQSSTNLQRCTPVIQLQPPTSIPDNQPFGNTPSFVANNHFNLIMMYQNLFPQQLAAHFRRLAENALQDKSPIPPLYPEASVSSVVKIDDGQEDSCTDALNARKILSDQPMSSTNNESKIPSLADLQDQVIIDDDSSRNKSRPREPSEADSEHEPYIKRSKHSDDDSEEIIVDIVSTDSSSQHESVYRCRYEYAPISTNSEAHHESPEHEANKKDEDLTVYVKGKQTSIYSCHICDCFFLKKTAHSVHMGAHMDSMPDRSQRRMIRGVNPHRFSPINPSLSPSTIRVRGSVRFT